MTTGFTDRDVPDQSGKTFLITGANTGIGFEAARVLAERGARVLLGCRSDEKAAHARASILKSRPTADVDLVRLDLADLASVRAAAKRVAEEPRLDVLVNNAGIMVPPYGLTNDGFESQFGTNHLGPFALTGLLLPKLAEQAGSRVVSTSSIAHKGGRIDFDDINAERGYSATKRYRMSKLANLLFANELHRRLSAAKSGTISVACHPGIADTELTRFMPRLLVAMTPLVGALFNTSLQGAWPTLMAATLPSAQGGEYFGPSKRIETAGPATKVFGTRRSQDPALAERLWELSVELTGVQPKIQ